MEKEAFQTTIDKSGRFVIPSRVLKTLSWDKGIVAIGEVVDDTVVIRSIGNQMICKKCNKKYSSQYKYCPICGELLSEYTYNTEKE